MQVQAHYQQLLAPVYGWMAGDFYAHSDAFYAFLSQNIVATRPKGLALDLGAGHGIQSVALARLGYRVMAVDTCEELLRELSNLSGEAAITPVLADMRHFETWLSEPVDMLACCGDTLTHLSSRREVEEFMQSVTRSLAPGGYAVFSFRDYTTPPAGTRHIIPVKSDENRILTCILDYENDHVLVTDLLQDRTPSGWTQKVSSYHKVRLSPDEVLHTLTRQGLCLHYRQEIKGMVTLLVAKPA